VVDEELRAPAEEVRQRGVPFIGVEAIVLVDLHPRQLLPPLRQLVAAPCELLLRREQLAPRREPLFPCAGLVFRHRSSLLQVVCRYDQVVSGRDIDLAPDAGTMGVTSVTGFRWTR